jgi:hypothetical protein
MFVNTAVSLVLDVSQSPTNGGIVIPQTPLLFRDDVNLLRNTILARGRLIKLGIGCEVCKRPV